MKRREFITVLGGAAVWSPAARAQQPSKKNLSFQTNRQLVIEQGTAAVWMIYTVMFGYPIPTNDTIEFDKLNTLSNLFTHPG
jgi:hypothetical protein